MEQGTNGDENETEYTRLKANFQRGEGVDRRGDVTIEIVRERDEDAPPREIELPDGETVEVACDDATFAEFYFEAQRAESVLIETLGLDEIEEDDE